MKLETKTTKEVLQELLDANFYTDDKKWTSNNTLILRLEEALSKTADSSKIVAVKRILKELKADD